MRKILLVEDEPVLMETYQMVLSTQPYESDFAENGKEALDDSDSLKSKIIIMSNLSSGKELDEARELGIQKHLLKSNLSPSQLVSEIRYHLEA
jgi:DNA-binding response OmpR family regulator